MKTANQVLAGFGTTIFEVMSKLARQYDAVNLGQGFPDNNGPADIRAVAAEALEKFSNQYPPMMGIRELRAAVAEHDRRFYRIELDWQRNVMVTSGATEALTASFLGLLNDGDEVVVFEPLYDAYVPMIRRAGGIARSVKLKPPDWQIPISELEQAFSSRTKMVVLNSPMNPSGKVFTRQELEAIATLVVANDAIIVCDEVYEHLVFGDATHIPMITLEGMAERCIRIASAGKTFSLTGWKVGYVTAPAALLEGLARAHQYLVFTTPPNLQHAVAYGLAKGDDYYRGLALEMESKRDRLARGLAAVGFEVATCDGTYFINARIGALTRAGEDDVAFCKRLIEQVGVASIPLSAFYLDHYLDNATTDTIRFCFAKSDATLDDAVARLGQLS